MDGNGGSSGLHHSNDTPTTSVGRIIGVRKVSSAVTPVMTKENVVGNGASATVVTDLKCSEAEHNLTQQSILTIPINSSTAASAQSSSDFNLKPKEVIGYDGRDWTQNPTQSSASNKDNLVESKNLPILNKRKDNESSSEDEKKTKKDGEQRVRARSMFSTLTTSNGGGYRKLDIGSRKNTPATNDVKSRVSDRIGRFSGGKDLSSPLTERRLRSVTSTSSDNPSLTHNSASGRLNSSANNSHDAPSSKKPENITSSYTSRRVSSEAHSTPLTRTSPASTSSTTGSKLSPPSTIKSNVDESLPRTSNVTSVARKSSMYRVRARREISGDDRPSSSTTTSIGFGQSSLRPSQVKAAQQNRTTKADIIKDEPESRSAEAASSASTQRSLLAKGSRTNSLEKANTRPITSTTHRPPSIYSGSRGVPSKPSVDGDNGSTSRDRSTTTSSCGSTSAVHTAQQRKSMSATEKRQAMMKPTGSVSTASRPALIKTGSVTNESNKPRWI